MRLHSITTFCDPTNTLALVRVTTDDGAIGWGQLPPWTANVSAHVLIHQVSWSAFDQPIDTVADLDALADRVLRRNYKFLGSHLWRAYSGLDLALWDLLGRTHGQPVARLIDPAAEHGGLRPLPAYASSMRRDIGADEEAARLKRLRDRHGFKAFKVRIGQPNGRDVDAAPGRSEAVIATCRKVLGDNATLLADANGGFSPRRAIEIGRLMESHNYAFFEEPCEFWELEQTAEVAQALDIAVAGGEQDHDLSQFRRMMDMGCVNIVQPDVCYVGGISRCLQVARDAATRGIPVIPHSANRTLLLPASLHVLSSIPNAGRFVEVGIDDVAAFREVYDTDVEVFDGLAHPPEGPGWGVTPRPEWLANATVDERTRL